MTQARNFEDSLGDLLRLADTPNTVFVLGAGASAPWIPTTPQVISRMRDAVAKDIPGGVPQEGMGPLKKILMVPNIFLNDEVDFRLGLVTEETLQFQYQKLLCFPSQDVRRRARRQYEWFNLSKKPRTIFTYNHDGLAPRYCDPIVVEMHGQIDSAYLIRAEEILGPDLFSITQDGFAIVKPTIWYPSPEPKEPIAMTPFSAMTSALLNASAAIVIGYSFGIQDDGSLADWCSFEVLCNALIEKPTTPVLVIDPGGQNLADRLEATLRTECVTWFPVYWNRLVSAMDSLMAKAQEYSLAACRNNVAQVLRLYDRD